MSEETLQVVDQPANKPDGNYTSGNVDVLRDAKHIRKNPGMYIGDRGSKGLHHLVFELVYNSVDEALAGYCNNIHVTIHVDGSLSVTDDGRGIPVEMHPGEGKPTLEVVLTTVGAGAKFDKRTYQTSAGLHGMGAKAVTALSEWTEAEVRRNGKVYQQEYERGYAVTPVKEIGIAPNNRTGTKITFRPDPEIFNHPVFDYDALERHLRELAYLNKGLSIKLTDERDSKEEVFFAQGGVSEFVEYINRTEDPIHKVMYVDKTLDNVRVEIAFQYTTGEEAKVHCYANNAYNPGGGTHLTGFRTALTRALGNYGNKENLFKNNLTPQGEDYREGITAIVSVAVPEPQFESQTKIRLNNPEVDGIVSSVLYEYLTQYLEENPKEAQKIMKKVILAAELREAAAKAKKNLKERKSILSSGGLPGKLMDCTSGDCDENEIFLVEGGSAGGSADNGRERHFQAVLPLRGKVLNVEKARMEKVLSNEELCSLISAIGIDIGNTEDISGLRYGKVILLTDADVDGQHIRTLLLTFFYRQMRPLIEKGHIWIARPPLFKVGQKKDSRYVQSIAEMTAELLTRGLDGTKLTVAAPEGVTAEPATYIGDRLKSLIAVLDDLEKSLVILERRGLSFATLLHEAKDGKLPIYRVLHSGKEQWLFTEAEVDAFRQQQAQTGHPLVVPDEETAKNGNGTPAESLFSVQELHEVKKINAGLEKLREFGLRPADLIPAPRIAGRDPTPRFFLESDGKQQVLAQLRVLVAEVRKFGEKGIKIVRFKGLGEMDGDELWDTTLDPARRVLLRVQLDDALKADEMFRILMGEKVEPRRDFINKHALDVKDLDLHGA